MQFRNVIAVLFFFLASICFASAAEDDDVIVVTMTTEIEITSTIYLDTVTITGQPTVTEEPEVVPITTIYQNGTWNDPSHTSPVNATLVPTPSSPTKDEDSSATSFSGSAHVAMAVCAVAALIGLL